MDIRLNFGKHAGKLLSQCPIGYVWWLSQQDIKRQNASQEAAYYLESIKTDDERESERELAIIEAEEAEEELELRKRIDANYSVEWISKSGKKINIRYEYDSINPYFIYRVDNGPEKNAYEIEELRGYAGFVAKLGNVALTAEQRDKLQAMEE